LVHEDRSSRAREVLTRAGLGAVPPVALVAVVVFACGIGVFALFRWMPGGKASGEFAYEQAEPGEPEAEHGSESDPAPGQTSVEASLVVYVVGAVRSPGVIRLAAGARVVEAIDAAGGFLGNAAIEAVNLARPAVDGEQIDVPTVDEWAQVAPPMAGTGAAGADGTSGTSGGAAGAPAQVDLNTADAATLETLPGIGPATATKIVADREANGPFASVEDLMRVSGIGPKFESLQELIVVR
jgi:competence protein ComEA